MKVLFTTAPHPKGEWYTKRKNSNRKTNPIFNKISKKFSGKRYALGPLYIAAVLKYNGHETYFLDGTFNSENDIIDYIKNKNIDLVGISSVANLWKYEKMLITKIKKETNAFVVLGGANARTSGEKCLAECHEIDFLVPGEGEFVLKNLIECLEKNKPIDKVKGILYRKKNEICVNQEEPLIRNLDKLPYPDRDLVDISNYIPTPFFAKRLPHTSIFASRGCNNRCKFCVSYNDLRLRNPREVVKEIEMVIDRYGIKDITFFDENFTSNKKHAIKICDLLIERDLDLIWSANSRVDTINKELIKKMRKAKCWKILLGIESGVQKNLDMLGKNITLKQIRETVNSIGKEGIETHGMFILGIPTETYEEGLRTIDFACELKLDYAIFNYLYVYPKTELSKIAYKFGTVKEFSDITRSDPQFIPYSMSEDQLRSLYQIAYKRFYSFPKYMLKRILKMRTNDDLKQNMRGLIMKHAFE